MAGPWEKYSQAEAQGPWAQYQKPAGQGEEKAPDPTEGMGWYEKYRAGLGYSASMGAKGLKQAVTDAARYAVESNPMLFGGRGNRAERALKESVERQAKAIDEERLLADPLTDTVPGFLGNVVGTGSQYLLPGAALRSTRLGRAVLPQTIKGNTALGSVAGALQGVGEGDSRLANTAIGAGAGFLGSSLPVAMVNTVRGVAAPIRALMSGGRDQAVASVLRGSATDPATLMRPAPSAVPGVQRSLAEESLDPGIASLQRAVQARTGQGAGFDTIRRNNNAARVGAIEKFAGDEAAVAQAVANRAQIANPLRRDAMQIEGVDTSRLLGQLGRLERAQEGRPAVQKALSDVRGLLQREVPLAERQKAAISPLMEYVQTDKLSAVNRDAAKEAIALIKAGEVPTAKFASPRGTVTARSADAGRDALKQSKAAFRKELTGQDRVAVLDNVRKTMGDMLSGKYGGDSAAAMAGSREIMAAKNQLDRVLAKQAPQYGQYIDAFKAASKPINRMEVGQTLLGKSSGAIIDPLTGQYTLTPAAFGRSVKNLDQVARQATGFNKAKAADILEPTDLRTIANVQDDLSRQSFADTAARQGSDTFQKLMNEGNILAAMEEIGASVPGAGVLKMLGRRGTERVNATLAEVLANPAQARAILAKAPATDRRIIQKVLATSGGGLGIELSSVAE